MNHVITWEFVIADDRESTFVETYGPDGPWGRLFRRAPGYLGTELIAMGGGRYRTIDRWDSQAAYDRFRADFAQEYAELDRACEPLCEVERPISSGD